jgi:hypothetical protein
MVTAAVVRIFEKALSPVRGRTPNKPTLHHSIEKGVPLLSSLPAGLNGMEVGTPFFFITVRLSSKGFIMWAEYLKSAASQSQKGGRFCL